MSTSCNIVAILLALFRLTLCVDHICNESNTPCTWNCDTKTKCINDTFICNSSSGCILNCVSLYSCNNANINKYGTGIMNMICNHSLSCNNIHINSYDDGYIYLLCSSYDSSCSNLNIDCMNHSHCFQSYTNIIIHKKLSFIHYIIILCVILSCIAFNMIFCCCHRSRKQKMNKKETNVNNKDDHTETQQKHLNKEHKEHNGYVVTLKPPNIDHIDIDPINNMEHNDLPNAPYLDLHELDEFEEDKTDKTMRGNDAEITFWKQLPSSPKKQQDINDDKHDFKESDIDNDNKESYNEDEIPNLSTNNNDNNLPIPHNKTDEFQLLNSNKSPFEHSIISPRNITQKSPKINTYFSVDNKENKRIIDEDKENFVENVEEEIFSKLSSSTSEHKKNSFNSKRSKQKSREMISIQHQINDIKSIDDSQIIKFNVNATINNDLKPIHNINDDDDETERFIHKFDGNLKFINDGFNHHKSPNKNKLNFANLFSSPKSKSPSISISPRNITAISPRKIINNIIKLSPRTTNHELLLRDNDDDEDEEDNQDGHNAELLHITDL